MAKPSTEKIVKKRNEIAREVKATDDIKTEKEYIDDGNNKKKREIDVDAAKELYLAAIQLAPIDPHIKMILRIRLEFGEESTEILMKIALKYGVKLQRLLDMEEEGKRKLKDYLRQVGNEDIVGNIKHTSTKFEEKDQKIIV